jgi:MFS family permease
MSLAQPIAPSTENGNFRHLVLDIAWYGLALAAYGRFLSVYAIKLGATPIEQGLLTSLPALILLIFASLGNWWTKRYTDPSKALIIPSVIFRMVFLLPAFAPFFPRHLQPYYLIACVSIPAITQGASGVAFQVLMRSAVSETRMPRLLSMRSLSLNIAVGIGALAFGVWLREIPFPYNCQLMFVLAFSFALVSLWHASRVRSTPAAPPAAAPIAPSTSAAHSSPWKSHNFRQVALVTLIIHVAFFSIVPVVNMYLVDVKGADEIFMGLYGIAELTAGALMSFIAPRILSRTGYRVAIALGMVGTSIAAIIIALAPHVSLTLIAAVVSGAAWTLGATISLFGFFNENTPPQHMTRYSTAFHQMIGLSVFIGPMVGSLLANSGMNLVSVLMIGAALRLIAAPLIEYPELIRWGHRYRIIHPRIAKP